MIAALVAKVTDNFIFVVSWDIKGVLRPGAAIIKFSVADKITSGGSLMENLYARTIYASRKLHF